MQSVFKGEAIFEQEEEDVNCLWLLEIVKKITTEIDNKCNKQFMLHKSLMSFFTVSQGETESKNSFLNRIKSNVQNLEMVGGINFMYST